MPKVRIVLQAATVCTKAAGALYIPLFRFSFCFLSFFCIRVPSTSQEG